MLNLPNRGLLSALSIVAEVAEGVVVVAVLVMLVEVEDATCRAEGFSLVT